MNNDTAHVTDPITGMVYIIRPEFQDYFFSSTNTNNTNHQYKPTDSLFCRPEVCGNPNLVPFIYDRYNRGLPVCLDWDQLSSNTHPLAIRLLQETAGKGNTKINWSLLSSNTSNQAVAFLKNHPQNIDWSRFSCNSNSEAVDFLLLESNRPNICWLSLCNNKNARAIYFLETQPNKIDWFALSGTQSQEAVDLISRNIHKLKDWTALSENPYAIELLEKHLDKVSWKHLSINSHTRAVQLLLQNPEKIDYSFFSANTNPVAVQWLEQNMDKIDWPHFSSNPGAIWVLEKHKEDCWNFVDLSALLFNEGLCTIF